MYSSKKSDEDKFSGFFSSSFSPPLLCRRQGRVLLEDLACRCYYRCRRRRRRRRPHHRRRRRYDDVHMHTSMHTHTYIHTYVYIFLFHFNCCSCLCPDGVYRYATRLLSFSFLLHFVFLLFDFFFVDSIDALTTVSASLSLSLSLFLSICFSPSLCYSLCYNSLYSSALISFVLRFALSDARTHARIHARFRNSREKNDESRHLWNTKVKEFRVPFLRAEDEEAMKNMIVSTCVPYRGERERLTYTTASARPY